MSKPAIRVSEAEAANDFPSLLARVRAGAEVVIERDAEAVAVIRPAAPDCPSALGVASSGQGARLERDA